MISLVHKEKKICNSFNLPSIAFVATFTRFDHSREAVESTSGIRELCGGGGGGTSFLLGGDGGLSPITRGESLNIK